jgi:hypothetical protein
MNYVAKSKDSFTYVLSLIVATLGGEALGDFCNLKNDKISGIARKLRLRNPWNAYLELFHSEMAKKSKFIHS